MKKPKIFVLSLILTLSLAAAEGCTGTAQTLSGNAPAASTEESMNATDQQDQAAAPEEDEDATSSATEDRDAPAGDGTVPPARPGKGGRGRPGTETPSTGTDDAAASESVEVPDKTFTLEELSAFDGKNGNDAYIAIDGTVYDVTHADGWRNGSHEGYSAGADLTDAFDASPHKDALLLTLTPVGTLADAS